MSKSYVGRLEGHSGIVVSCKILLNSPNALSVDDKNDIRIWDLRTHLTVQLIRDEYCSTSQISVTCLECIPSKDMFIVGGKRIQMYNNDYMRKNLETFNEEICPLHVDFNYYYKVFYVLTKIDIRLYDAFTGKLLKVYTELHDELAPNSELTAYAIGDKERKFYIADNAGMVRMYNCNNGEIIHKIISMTNLKDWNKMSHSKNCKENYRSKNYEISKMLYLEEEKLLITGSCDSVIRIFEADQEMDPHLLRELKDGHKGSEISALCYSSSFMRLASGSTNGIVSVWDFENNKAESLF